MEGGGGVLNPRYCIEVEHVQVRIDLKPHRNCGGHTVTCKRYSA